MVSNKDYGAFLSQWSISYLCSAKSKAGCDLSFNLNLIIPRYFITISADIRIVMCSDAPYTEGDGKGCENSPQTRPITCRVLRQWTSKDDENRALIVFRSVVHLAVTKELYKISYQEEDNTD